MPLQNRVTPTGEIVNRPWRGALMGNRGRLHDAENLLGTARWRHSNWVCCVTEFRGRHREVMPPPGSPTVYTALFFWDEAAAFAAGHRPCAQCRYADYRRFIAAWKSAGLPGTRAHEIDRHLQPRRVRRDRSQVRVLSAVADLPVGTFILIDEKPVLIAAEEPFVWSDDGYQSVEGAMPEHATVLTPEPYVALFRAGYRPEIRLA